MQIFKDLQTEQGQAEFKAPMSAETARIIAEMRTDKEANGGLSKSQRSPRADWQYTNGNFGMGI